MGFRSPKHLSAHEQQLIVQYLPLARSIAKKTTRSLPLDERISQGYVGLVEAAIAFDESLKVDFGHFAKRRIRGAIIDFKRKEHARLRSIHQSSEVDFPHEAIESREIAILLLQRLRLLEAGVRQSLEQKRTVSPSSTP